jgi:hypothetical protein
MRLFCFGFGYSAEALARCVSARTSALAGTRTSLVGAEPSVGARLAAFQGDGAPPEVRSLLALEPLTPRQRAVLMPTRII